MPARRSLAFPAFSIKVTFFFQPPARLTAHVSPGAPDALIKLKKQHPSPPGATKLRQHQHRAGLPHCWLLLLSGLPLPRSLLRLLAHLAFVGRTFLCAGDDHPIELLQLAAEKCASRLSFTLVDMMRRAALAGPQLSLLTPLILWSSTPPPVTATCASGSCPAFASSARILSANPWSCMTEGTAIGG